MAHGHGNSGHGGAAVHGSDFVPVPPVHPAGAGDSASHHGHTIVASSTLMVVLVALVGLTVLTVGAALIEAWIVETFHVQPEIASAINIGICLAIAVVKTTLVVMFFMQLKYDNPINTMIFLFCLAAVACFLGFTMLDLGNRGTIDRFKAEYVQAGGMGLQTPAFEAAAKVDPSLQANQAITVLATKAAIINKEYKKSEAEEVEAHLRPPPPKFSDANQSRPVRGVEDEPEGDAGR
jgi:cytochrome c oxidase subunit 4